MASIYSKVQAQSDKKNMKTALRYFKFSSLSIGGADIRELGNQFSKIPGQQVIQSIKKLMHSLSAERRAIDAKKVQCAEA